MDEVQKPKPKTIPVTKGLHALVKVAAAREGKTIQDLVGEILTPALEKRSAA